MDLPRNAVGHVVLSASAMTDDGLDGVPEDNTIGAETLLDIDGNKHMIGADGALSMNMSLENSSGFKKLTEMYAARMNDDPAELAIQSVEKDPSDLSDLAKEVGLAPAPSPRVAQASTPPTLRHFGVSEPSELRYANFCPCCNNQFSLSERYCPQCGTKRPMFRPASE